MSIQYPPEAWQRLGKAVRQRIDRCLVVTDKEVAARAGFSDETLSKIINARATAYAPRTITKLALALEWHESVPYDLLKGEIDVEQAVQARTEEGGYVTVMTPWANERVEQQIAEERAAAYEGMDLDELFQHRDTIEQAIRRKLGG